MRFLPILTSVIVAGLLYMAVVEREFLLSLSGISETPGDGQVSAQASSDEPDGTAQEVEGPEGVPVVAIRSRSREVENLLVLSGRTEANRFVEIRSQASGVVISETLEKGSFVERNQLLCRLDPGAKQSSLIEAEARLAEAELNHRAAERLAEGGFGSENRAVATSAALKSAQAAVQRNRIELERTEILAPFDGLLESNAAEFGSLLQPGSLCARVIQLDPIKVVGHVTETQVSQVQLDTAARVRLVTGETVSGRVSFVSRSADESTRTFRLEVKVPNADRSIRDGLTAEIELATRLEMAHLLPQSALTLNDSGVLGVRTTDDGLASFMPVTVLRDSSEGVWVAGLPHRADIIVVGQEFVADGGPVIPVYKDELL